MGLLKKGIIVDATTFHKFTDVNHEDSKPVHQYIKNQKLKLVYGNDTKSVDEIKKDRDMFNILRVLANSGAVYQVDSKKKKQEIEDHDKVIKGETLKSNDIHIIAVALVEKKARLLFSTTKGDKKLHKDFTNPKIIKNPRGNIYQKKEHKHLLQD